MTKPASEASNSTTRRCGSSSASLSAAYRTRSRRRGEPAGGTGDGSTTRSGESYDVEIRAETDEALAQTGKDVGTPIIHFEPPSEVAFSGPVISRLPREDQALELWDPVIGLARFPGFAEIKRSIA